MWIAGTTHNTLLLTKLSLVPSRQELEVGIQAGRLHRPVIPLLLKRLAKQDVLTYSACADSNEEF
jgi:hypothetical protein